MLVSFRLRGRARLSLFHSCHIKSWVKEIKGSRALLLRHITRMDQIDPIKYVEMMTEIQADVTLRNVSSWPSMDDWGTTEPTEMSRYVLPNRRPILGRKPSTSSIGDGIGHSGIWGPMLDDFSSSDGEMQAEHDMRVDTYSSSLEDCIAFDIGKASPSSSICEALNSRYTQGLHNFDSKPASPSLCANVDFFSSFDRSPPLSPLLDMNFGFFRDTESHSPAISPSAYQSTGFFRDFEHASSSSSSSPAVIGSSAVKGSDMDCESLVGLSNVTNIGQRSESTATIRRNDNAYCSSRPTSNMSEVDGYRRLSIADLHIAVPVLPVPMLTTNQTFLKENRNFQTAHSQDDAIRYCVFCKKNRETREFYTTHVLKDPWGKVICPVLRKYVCRICGATGNNAHTLRHCPSREDVNI